jgi:hypothetical protein
MARGRERMQLGRCISLAFAGSRRSEPEVCLESLIIEFESPRFLPESESRRPPLQTCVLLPVFKKLQFKGVDEYLEYLVAQIDAPLLNNMEITFFHQDQFHTAQLTLFISHAPKFKAYGEAYVTFSAIGPLTFRSHFNNGQLMESSSWESCAIYQISNFCLWHRCATRSSLRLSFSW